MTSPQHIYQIHIKATPDQVWKAITEPGFISRSVTLARPKSSTLG